MNSKKKILSGNKQFKKQDLLLLLFLNYIPLILVILCFSPFFVLKTSFVFKCLACVSILYLLPPALACLSISIFGLPKGKVSISSKEFFVWWLLFQLQAVFNRLPFLEELLRIIPGVYSLWLRFWGSKIGKLTFWSPGVRILDRSYLQIGDNVIFGAGVRLNPHVVDKNSQGILELMIDNVSIENDVVVGGYALVTTGSIISSGERTKATLLLPPYSVYKNGRRIKKNNFFI